MKLRNILTLLFLCCAMSALAKGNVITVKNARQFIEALGNDRTIVIDSKTPLNITETLSAMIEERRINIGNPYYTMNDEDYPITTPPSPTALETVTYCECFDGPGLQIRDLSGLTIRAKKGMATLLATPRYANVLEFINCDGIVLDHLILGHTEEGYCDKGVVEFDGCSICQIDDCEFFGCGTEGFVFYACTGITVNRSSVYDCSYHTMHVNQSSFIRFNDCRFYNNREYEQVNIYNSECVCFTHCTFDNLTGSLFSMSQYVNFYGCVFHDCEIEPVTSDFDLKDYAILRHCVTAYGGQAPAVAAEKPQFKLGRYTDGSTTYEARRKDDYSIVFEETEGCGGFAINCINALTNEYETDFHPGLENIEGRLGARLVENNGQSFIVLLDDGGEPCKNYVYLGK